MPAGVSSLLATLYSCRCAHTRTHTSLGETRRKTCTIVPRTLRTRFRSNRLRYIVCFKHTAAFRPPEREQSQRSVIPSHHGVEEVKAVAPHRVVFTSRARAPRTPRQTATRTRAAAASGVYVRRRLVCAFAHLRCKTVRRPCTSVRCRQIEKPK